MIEARNVRAAIVAGAESSRSRGIRWSVAAAMLAGTALVPATAQTFDIGGGPLVVSDFAGPPLNNPTEITNGQLTVNTAANLPAFGGNLTDSLGVLSFTKSGTGTITLAGINTHSGPTLVNGGTLVAGSAFALSANSTLTVNGATVDLNGLNNTVAGLAGNASGVVTTTGGPATLTVNNALNTSFGGALQGDLGLTKLGAGTLTITNSNPGLALTTMSGPITLAGGRLDIGSDNSVGSGTITVNGASVLGNAGGGTRTLNNDIVMNVGLTVVASANTFVLGGNISGANALTKAGFGTTIALTGANSYSGGTVLTGTILVGNAAALGTGDVTLSNAGALGLFNPAASLAFANNIVLSGHNVTFLAPDAGVTMGVAGNISGPRGINISGGGGEVLLSGTNSFTLAANVNSGVLALGSAGALNGASSVVFAPAATGLRFAAAGIDLARQLTDNGAAASVTIDTGAFDATLSGRLHDSATGSLGLTKTGSGTLTISNASAAPGSQNVLTGGVAVTEGTLNLTGRLEGTITMGAGTTLAGSGEQATSTTSLASGTTLSPGDVAGGPNAVGTLRLGGLITSGSTNLNFNLGAPSIDTVTPINDLVVVAGSLDLRGTINILALPGFDVGTYRLMTYGVLSGNTAVLGSTPLGYLYNLNVGGGNVDLEVLLADFYWDGTGPFGNNVVDGGTGTWDSVTTNFTDVTGTLTVAYNGILNTSRVFFQGTAGTVTLGDTFLFDELHFLTDGYVINPTSAEVLAGDSITIHTDPGVTARINAEVNGINGLTKTGTGTLVLGGANTHEGGTALTAGRIDLANNGALGVDGLTMSAGTTLGNAASGVNVGNAIAISGGVTFDAIAMSNWTVGGAITGSGGFTKTGVGGFNLNGNNSFTGDIDVQQGSLTAGTNTALGDVANVVTLQAGTRLTLGAAVDVANAIVLAGAANIGKTGSASPSTITGNISGGGSLALFGTGGLLNLSGNNSYSGGTTINTGAIGIGSNTAFGTGTVTVAGAATLASLGAIETVRTLANDFVLNADTTVTGTGATVGGPPYGFVGNVLELNGNLSGAGNLQVVGGGALALGGNNGGYTGNIIVGDGSLTNGGRLRVLSANGLGTGTITLNRVSVLGNFTGATLTINNNILVDGNGFEFAGVTGLSIDDNIIINGDITGFGNGSFNKLGGITVTLNGNNNYNQLFLDGGRVIAGNNSALGNGQIINTEIGGSGAIEAGADGLVFGNNIFSLKGLVLDTAAFTMTLNGNINNSGAFGVTKDGSGTLILNGANGFTGGLVVNGGTVVAGSNTALGNGGANFGAGTTLRSGANVSLANNLAVAGGVTIDTPFIMALTGDIVGSGGITKTGSNGLQLSGNNSFTGGFNFTEGQINLFSSTGFGDASSDVFVSAGTFGVTLANGLNVANNFALAGLTSFTVGGGETATLAGVISGAGRIFADGAGTLVLNGNNSYAGGTSVNGTLQLGNGNAAGTGAITLNAATLAAGADLTLANGIVLNGDSGLQTNGFFLGLDGVVSGTGGLTVATTAGAPFGGTVNLNNAGNSFAGDITINPNAILSAGSDAALGNAANNLAINEGLFLATASMSTARNIALGGTFGQIDTAGGATLQVDGLISGSQLRVNGNELILTNGGNSYVDGTVHLGGRLVVAANGALGTGNAILFNNSTLAAQGDITLANGVVLFAGSTPTIDSGAGVFTLNGIITQTAAGQGFTKAGNGTLVLNGANDYTGDTNVLAGTVVAGSDSAFGAGGTVTWGADTTLRNGAGGALTIANPFVLGGTFNVDVNDQAVSLAGNISGNGPLNVASSTNGPDAFDGSLTLAAGNSFTGTVTASFTTLNIGADSALGDAGNALVLSFAQLNATADITSGRNVTLASNYGQINVGPGLTLTLNGLVDGGQLGFTGGGTLVLNGNNSYTGGTIAAPGGTLQLGNDNAAGTGSITLGMATLAFGNDLTLANDIVITGGATIATNNQFGTLNGLVSGNGPLNITTTAGAPFGGGVVLANNSNSFTGNVTVGPNAILGISADGALGNVANGLTINEGLVVALASFTTDRAITLGGVFGQIDVNGADVVTANGVISGSQLRKGGNGTLIIGNAGNSFTDGTAIFGGGTLGVAASNVLGGGLINLIDGTLAATGAGPTVLANDINIGGAGNTIDSGAGRFTLSGAIAGNDDFTKAGAGILELTGNSSYSGIIQLTAGEIDLEGSIAGGINGATGTLVTGAGTAAGASVLADGATLSPGNSPGTVTFGSLVLNNATNLIFDLDVINTVGVTNDLVVVNNDLTLDGLLQVIPGANFNIGVGNYTLFTYGNLLADNTVNLTGALLTPPAGVTYTVLTTTGIGAGAGSVLLNVEYNGTYFFDGVGAPIDGIIQGGAGTWNGALTNWTNSDGLFNLVYNDAFDRVVQFGAGPGGTFPGGTVTVEGTRQFGTINFTDTGYVLAGAGDLAIDNGTINVDGAGIATVSVAINGVNGLTKGGDGELIVTTANGYTGGTNVNAGVLTMAANGSTGTGTVALANGTTLRSVLGTDIAHGNAVAITGTATFDVNSALFSQDGVISGGNLVKTGAGQLQLTTNNTYGNTNITSGSFRATQDASLGLGTVTMADGTFGVWSGGQTAANNFVLTSGVVRLGVEAGSTTLNGTVGGNANLEKFGDGRLVLGNTANTYTGGTNITAGTLAVAGEGSLGTGNIRFSAAGGTLETLSSFTTAKTVLLDANGTIDTNANTNRFDGVISGAAALTKEGSGRLILTGTNTYQGGTFLNAGSLQVDDGNAIGSGILTTQNGTTFVAGLAPGAGTITLANNVVLAGGQTTFDMVGTFIGVNVTNGGVSTNGTNLVINGTISGAGGFTTSAATAGQMTINGNNSFTGDVFLNSAVVTVGSDTALGVGNTVTLGSLGGIRNAAAGTTRTLANNIVVADPNATLGGSGNLVITGALSGSDPAILNKVGLGTVTLANANNTIGALIEVAQGELSITGALTNAAQLTRVNAGATLSGTGSIAGTVEVLNSGVLSAGVGGAGQVGKLTIGTLLLNEQSSLVFDLGDNYVLGGPLNDTIEVTNLRLGGRLTVRESVGGSFGLGVYNLFTYQGALLAGSTAIDVQSLPGAFTGVVQTLIPGQVNLVVTNPGTFIQYWDGGDALGNSTVDGGTGTWSVGGTNWTGLPDSQLNTTWFNNSVAVFAGTAGTVTLASMFNAQGLQFTTDGYLLTGGILDNQSTGVGTGMFVATMGGVTATIDSTIQGDGLLFKQGTGTLALGGNNVNFSGGTIVQQGTLQLNTAMAAGTNSITLEGGTTLANGGGTLTVANNVITNGAGTIDSGAGSFTLTGTISGVGSVIKTGTGTLTLTGVNSYLGGTQLNAGTLAVTNNLSISTGALAMANGTTLQAAADGLNLANAVAITGTGTVDTQANGFTLSGVISGDTLTKIGSGNLTLLGDNTYTGGTNLNAGSITVGTSTALGTGTLAMSDATSLIAGANGLVLANAVTTAGVGTIDTGAFTFTLNGVVSGAGSITKIGSGNLVLNGANSYAGGTALNAGTITVGTSTALGTGTLTAADATSLVAGADALNVANNAVLNGGLTVDSGAGIFTLSGVISGAGSITKVNGGNLVLSGVNTYSGGTNLTAGSLTVTNDSSIGTGTLTTSGGTSLIAGLTAPSAATINLANSIVLGAGTTNVVLQGTAINFFAAGGTAFDGTALTLGGPISGDGGLAIGQNGRVNLNGANSYAGGTAVTASAVYVGTDSALGTGTLTSNGMLLGNDSGALRTLANNVVLNSGMTVSAENDITLNGVISGASGISKTATGTLTLNGDNSYSGFTSLFGGRITVGTSTALGTANMTVFNVGQSTTLAAGADGLVLANNIALNATSNLVVESGAGSFTLAGVISGAGALTKIQSGNLILNGDNSYAGGTSLNAGTITVGTSTALGTGQLVMADATTLAAGADALALANGITTLGAGTVDTAAFTFTLNGVVDGAGSITKIGSGNLVLNGANSYTGGSFINAGTVTAGNNTAFGTGLVTMLDGTTLANNTDNLVIANDFVIGNVTVATGANTFTMNGVVNGAGLLTKTGSGNLVLNGANGYTGGTALTAGTITIGNNTALGTGQLVMSDGTFLVAGVDGLSVANNITTLGAGTVNTQGFTTLLSGVIDGAGSITKIGSGALILSGVNTYSGGTNLNAGTLVITNDASIGTGTLTTTGGTAVNVGTAAGASITLANNVVLGAGTTFVNLLGSTTGFPISGVPTTDGSTLVLNGPVSGDRLFVNGAGFIRLNGNNSYTGGTVLEQRVAAFVGSDTAFGTGMVEFAPFSGLINDSGATRTLANDMLLTNAAISFGGVNDMVLTGTLSGNAQLSKIGPASLTITSASTRTGQTYIGNGEIIVGNDLSLGTGQVRIDNGSIAPRLSAGVDGLTLANNVALDGVAAPLTINSNAFTFTLNGTIFGAGGIVKIGSGNLVLNGDNSYANGSLIEAGTVTVGTNTALGTNLVTMLDGTTLANNTDNLVVANNFLIGNVTVATGANTFTMNGLINGAGLLTKTGSGNLILNGANGYTGGTALTAGTITVGNNTALGTGHMTMSDGTFLVAGVDGLTLANSITTLGVGTVNTQAFTFTLNGDIDGPGSIVKIGSGNLVLNGNNSFGGGVFLNTGTITVGSNTALGTGLVTMADGTLLQPNTDGLVIANNFNIGNVAIDTGAFTFTLNGVVNGSGPLTKFGTGNLVLNGANGYTGGTFLTNGTITVGNDTALGTGQLVMSDGTFLVAGIDGLSVANNITTLGVGTVNTQGFLTTLAGVIDGAGSITKIGGGNLVLSGVNTYSGGTNLNAGTLTVTNNSSIGTGTLTTTGGTSINVGTLAGVNTAITLANNVVLGAGSTSINLQGTRTTLFVGSEVDTDGAALTLNGTISGDGALVTTSFGTLTLNGNNSYSGGTTIGTRGVLYVGTDTAAGTGAITLGESALYNNSGATRTLANAIVLGGGASFIGGFAGNDLVLNGVISGGTGGELFKVGVNSLTLNGNNVYSGRTYLAAGNITVGTSTALGTGLLEADEYNLGNSLTAGVSGLVLANNVLLSRQVNLVINSGAGSFTLAGGISGNGGLTKQDGGNLILNGDNSYTGGTALAAGTITVGTSTALGTGGLVMSGGTFLVAGADSLALANAITTLGVGTIDTGSFTFTLNGVIGGAGSITKIGSGNLVLNGANGYTGGTSINTGTVTVGSNTALGTGLVTMANGTSLVAGVSGLTLANAFSIGNVTINSGSGIFTLGGTINGAGLLTKVGGGTLVLNGANGYTGGTALTAGTIRVGTSTALGTGDLTMSGGTILQAGAAGLSLANNIAMLDGATVDVNGEEIALGGVISGTGPLSVIDSQTVATAALTLSGENSYTGGTRIVGTTVQVSRDVNLGNSEGGITLVDGGRLRTTASFTSARTVALVGEAAGRIDVAGDTRLTLNGVISGNALTKQGGGELKLNGANSYEGGTLLQSGTIVVGNNSALGTGKLTMNDGTRLWAEDDGLAIANAVTTLGNGTIQVGPTNISNGINEEDGPPAPITFTMNGVIDGDGSITKTGTGILVLNGANSYAGGTALAEGTIRVGTNTAVGSGTLTMSDGTTLDAGAANLTLANSMVTLGNATVNVGSTASTFTLSGPISGAGGISKTGAGILTLSATSSYTGPTTVAAGTLNVTGSLVSAVTVASGATITGNGTVGALTVSAGANLRPGAPGTTQTATLTVTGAANLLGAYQANITPSANDRVTAGGALTLGGSLAIVQPVPGNFTQFNQTFTLASGSSRTGTFGTVTGLDQFGIAFAPVMEYTATQANVRLAPQSLVVLGNRFGGISGNALEVAQAFDRAVAGGYNPQAFFNVYANGGSNLPRTLREMSGEQRATERRVVLDTNRVFRETALDRLNSGMAGMGGQQVTSNDGDRSITFWLRGAGSWNKSQTSNAATAFTAEQRGILTGLDWSKDALTVGGMFHYTSTNIDYQVLGGSSNVETVGGTIYAGYRKDGGLVINAGGSIAGARTNGNRAITLPTFTQTLSGRTRGTTYQVFGELGWDLAAAADTQIEPFARLTHVRADMGALVETGGVAALSAAKQNYDITVVNLGARFGADVADGKVGLHASASWQRTSGDRTAATIIGIPAVGQNGNIQSIFIDKNALNLQADASVNLSDTIRFSLGYSGLIGKRNDDHGARATLNFAF